MKTGFDGRDGRLVAATVVVVALAVAVSGAPVARRPIPVVAHTVRAARNGQPETA
jgi:hypothetical protein